MTSVSGTPLRSSKIISKTSLLLVVALHREMITCLGLYLAIPFFPRCSDRQPVWLVNRTAKPITYISRSLYAYASTDDGVDEYQAAGSAFKDGIAVSAVIAPGNRLQVDDYSMSFDGDFVSNPRIVLTIDGERREWFVSVSKLGGYLWDKELHGFHALKDVTVADV